MQRISVHISKCTDSLIHKYPSPSFRQFSSYQSLSRGSRPSTNDNHDFKVTRTSGGPRWSSPEKILKARKALASNRGLAPQKKTLSPYQVAAAISRAYDDVAQRVYSTIQNGDVKDVQSWGVHSAKALTKACEAFRDLLLDDDGPEAVNLRDELARVIEKDGDKALFAELKYRLQGHIVGSKFSPEDVANQKRVADLRYPSEWFPATRALQRKIFLHVGPTNSGKTYQALQRLENAESGIYAGPLRLLAHEVYTRLNAKGKACALVTGEEKRYPEGYGPSKPMISCTVEMVPRNTDVEVAVIDEIQMIGSPDRGWAWTQALLSVRAKEIHLCGEARTVPLIREICAALGDELVVNEYKRLSPLQTMDNAIGNYNRLEKGDCLIVFSRVGIHNAKREIEQKTKRKCAIIYGSLPPETRAQQALLFNEPDNDYDFLVASDAIGMGLNLSIKRVVFDATSKHNGKEHETLEIAALKQIAGRAGRFKSAHEATTADKQREKKADDEDQSLLDLVPKKTLGLVTAMEHFDLPVIQRAMMSEPPPMPSAGIFPPDDVVLRFATYFPPGTPLSYILMRLHAISVVHPRFHLCNLRDQVAIADVIQPYGLSTRDMLTFVAAPIPLRDQAMAAAAKGMAKALANNTGGELLDIKEIDLDILDKDPFGAGAKGVDPLTLRGYESLHKILTLYLWLSYRFAGVFRSQALAFHVKALVEAKIVGFPLLCRFEARLTCLPRMLRWLKPRSTRSNCRPNDENVRRSLLRL